MIMILANILSSSSKPSELFIDRVQPRMISVDNFFVFLRLLFFALLLHET